MMFSFVLACAAIAQTAATVPSMPIGTAQVLNATAGKWRGELQYRDYQSNRWEGLPVDVTIVAQPDGVTTVRTAAFDDGPKTGTVWITTIAMIDPVSGTQGYAAFRKGRKVDGGSASIAFAAPPRDVTHWTIIELEHRQDGDSMAQVRETTTRDGASLTTLKEVDVDGDDRVEWRPRNRTILKLVE